MINSREIADKYTREGHTAFGNTKRQGVYRNSKYVCCLLLFVTLFSYTDNQLLALSAEADMPNLCEIPEDLSAFKALYNTVIGLTNSLENIYGPDIELLKNQMEVIEEKEAIDHFYSSSRKVKVGVLTKKCIAADGVPYRFNVGIIANFSGSTDVITDLYRRGVFGQFYLKYKKEDILNGRRKFSFDTVDGSNQDYAELIAKNTVGLMNRKQLDQYMESLGCSKEATDKKGISRFFYDIEPERDMASRLSRRDFSKEILVDFNAGGIVKKITVSFW